MRNILFLAILAAIPYSCVSTKQAAKLPPITIEASETEDLLATINRERSKRGFKPLMSLSALTCAAQNHALDIGPRKACTHYGRDGSSFITRAKRCGYNLTSGGEIVACGQKTAKDAVNAWLKSSGHYSIMMDPNQKYFGAGMKNNYWVVVFSKK